MVIIKKFRSVGVKITMTFLIAGLLPLVVTSIFNSIIVKEILDFSETKNLFSITQLQANVIKNIVLIRHNEINSLNQELQETSKLVSNNSPKVIEEYIRLLKVNKHFQTITVLNQSKDIIYLEGQTGDEVMLPKLVLSFLGDLNPSRNILMTPFYLNKNNHIEQSIINYMIIDNKPFYGIFSYLLQDAPGISDVIIGLELTGAFYGGVPKGDKIYYQNLMEPQKAIEVGDEDIDKEDEFQLDEKVSFYNKIPGYDALFVRYFHEELGLYIMVKKDWSEIYSQFKDWNFKIIGGITATSIMILLLALVVSKYLSTPIIRLRDEIQKILQSGKIDVALDDIDRNDELGNLASSFHELMDNLSTSNKAKRQFVHILCHDLKNPIGAASLAIEMCMAKPDRSTKYLPKALDQLKNGIDVIDLVRTMEALDDGKVQLELSTINLNHALNASLETLEENIESKNIQVKKEVDPSLEVVAQEISLVNSVLNNILTNAIKFSPRGGVIEISGSEEDGFINLYFKDHGIGMPRKLLSKIFDANETTSRRGTDGEKGTGYGMPLVKKFIQNYGGEITVESTEEKEDPENHGTTIKIKFKKP